EDKPGTDRFDARVTEKMGGAPKILNTCLAYAADGPLVRRRWPHLYTGDQEGAVEPAQPGSRFRGLSFCVTAGFHTPPPARAANGCAPAARDPWVGGASRRRSGRRADPRSQRRPVIGRRVSAFSGRGAEIADDEHPHRAGATAAVPGFLDPADQGAHVLAFPLTDFQQCVPEFRLQPHAGSSTRGDDIAIDKTTDRHA